MLLLLHTCFVSLCFPSHAPSVQIDWTCSEGNGPALHCIWQPCDGGLGASQVNGKDSACNASDAGDASSIPGSERTPGGGNGNPLQYSCLVLVGYSPWGCKKSDTNEHAPVPWWWIYISLSREYSMRKHWPGQKQAFEFSRGILITQCQG